MLARQYGYYEEDYALEAARQRQQELLERKARREQASAQALRLYLLRLLAIGFCGYMLCVGLSSWALYEGNQLVALQKQERLLSSRNSELKIEVEQLKSPNRIITLAEQQMGMRVARSNIYVNALPQQGPGAGKLALAGK